MAVKEKYRLNTLLTLRQRTKTEAEHELARQLAALKTEQDKLKDLKNELEKMVARREARIAEHQEQVMRGELNAHDTQDHETFINTLKELEEDQQREIEDQEEVIKQHEQKVKKARNALVEASQELKVIEKNKEKWARIQKKKLADKEDENLDELGQTMHRKKGQ